MKLEILTSSRVFVRFGQAIGVIAWESLDDFPDARKIVNKATTTWPFFIFIVFIPQCMLAFSLLGTPYLCKGVGVRELFVLDGVCVVYV